MRTLRKNMQKLKYVLYEDEVPIYEKDSEGNVVYDDIDGEEVPRIVDYQSGFGEPVEFFGNIMFSGSPSEAEVYGVSIGSYDSRMVLSNDKIPITETSLIFKESAPQYDTNGKLKESSADFRVIRVARGLTDTVYLLQRIVHNEDVKGKVN